MAVKKSPPTTIDDYIARCPTDVQPIMQKIRATIKKSAPRAVEKISYGMPAFALNGDLVWFGAFKHHIGFFPKEAVLDVFKDELAPYKHAKATLQFPLDQPIPYALIRKIVKFRVAENLKK